MLQLKGKFPTADPPGMRGRSVSRPSFLLVCDEWSPTRGGISTFNRSLATGLAAEGYHTVCLVESASPREHEDARARGVKLITAEWTPAGANLYVCATAAREVAPDVVIGHDRVTGSIAWTYVTKYLQAALVHIIHTAPPEIEPYKRTGETAQRTEAREQMTRSIAADADIVAAVGPRLARYAEAVVGDGFGGVSVLQLDPGLDIPEGIVGHHRRQVPSTPTVLVLGRTGDIELKGLDIAARAVASLTGAYRQPNPSLLVRGAPAAECDRLHSQLVRLSGLARDRVDVRPFTDDLDQISRDLRRAALCVLPSRAEGFGLAALEAISVGTPVLVSDRSGVAETLRDRLDPIADRMIVKVVDNNTLDVARWSSAIQQVLDDLPAAFGYAHEVRSRLGGVLSWNTLVDALVVRLASVDRHVRDGSPTYLPMSCS